MKKLTLKEILEHVNTGGGKVTLSPNRLLPKMFLYRMAWRTDLLRQYIIESEMPIDSDHTEFYFIEKYNESEFLERVGLLLEIGILFNYKR